MVYSSILSLKNSKSDVIICYSDILFDKKFFSKLMSKKFKDITIPYLKS